MFRAEIHQLVNDLVLTMEGRLVGDWAEEARSLIMRTSVTKRLIVDMTELTYVDATGERSLSWLSSIGAVFIANAVYAAAVCERLHLSLLKTELRRR